LIPRFKLEGTFVRTLINRLEYGVPQNKLAVHVGISRQYISKIETGKVTPSDITEKYLVQCFGTI